MSERTHKKSNWSSTTPQQDSALKLRRFTTKDDKDEEIQQSPDLNLSKFSLPTNSPFPDSNIQRQQLEGEKEEGEETPGAQLKSDKTTSEEPEEEIQAKSEEPNQEIDEPVQTKLTVGQPGDKYEQEADTVAAKVVEQINSPQTNQPVQGKVEPVVKPTVMRQGGAVGGAVNQDVEQNIQQARGSGQGLAENVRQPMEQAFGADFSGVKVHTDGQADVLNKSLNSRAFATGQDIFFKQGEYQPGSKQGQELLAHELTHVVQQGGTGSQVQRLCGVDESCPQDMMDSSNMNSSAGMTSSEAPMSVAVTSSNYLDQSSNTTQWARIDNPTYSELVKFTRFCIKDLKTSLKKNEIDPNISLYKIADVWIEKSEVILNLAEYKIKRKGDVQLQENNVFMIEARKQYKKLIKIEEKIKDYKQKNEKIKDYKQKNMLLDLENSMSELDIINARLTSNLTELQRKTSEIFPLLEDIQHKRQLAENIRSGLKELNKVNLLNHAAKLRIAKNIGEKISEVLGALDGLIGPSSSFSGDKVVERYLKSGTIEAKAKERYVMEHCLKEKSNTCKPGEILKQINQLRQDIKDDLQRRDLIISKED